ncbi:Spindle pole body component alp6, partial [Neolecta irregularis DAH-3]
GQHGLKRDINLRLYTDIPFNAIFSIPFNAYFSPVTRNLWMSEARIADALARLVDGILELDPEDEKTASLRQEAIEHARNVVASNPIPSVEEDLNHISEQIRTKLMRENTSPEATLRYSNLFSRLQSQPIIRNKWGILYLLYSLSLANSAEPNASTRPTSRSTNKGLNRISDIRLSVSQSSPRRGCDDRREGRESRGRGNEGIQRWGPGPMEPSERTLLRDIPFLLQGISSTHIKFSTPTTMTLPQTLPLPVLSLLRALSEPGLLYKDISTYIANSHDPLSLTGLVGQSLVAALSTELIGYLNLVAALEGEIRRELGLPDNEASGGVTLKRCLVWLREATLGLRLMSVIKDESRNKKGGQLISCLHGFSSHGDPFVHAFAEKLLKEVTRSFYEMLQRWIYDGELQDPFLEFFVVENRNQDSRSESSGYVWEGRYSIDERMIPPFLSDILAQKIFLIGKSLNFIRYGCGDVQWVESHSKASSRGLSHEDISTLDVSIDSAYKTTTARLNDLITTRFKLFEHLHAFKKYLMLGQGDFIALLMDSLQSSLDQKASLLYRHNLTATLESAIRGSNAQYDPDDITRRLDARLLELAHGDIGWDVFTLEYKVDSPLDVIVTSWSARQYLKIFNFLWRVKRVEFALNNTWRTSVIGERAFLNVVKDVCGSDWQTVRCASAEMTHFICQLQYYIQFEVIESSWEKLQAMVAKPDCTLDTYIQAHERYLSQITHKGLLGAMRHGRDQNLMDQLHEIFKTILNFKDAVEQLNGLTHQIYLKNLQRKSRAEARTAAGKWGVTEEDDRQTHQDETVPHANQLNNFRQLIPNLIANFRGVLTSLLTELAHQPDLEMRFLGVRLNYNEFYKLRTRISKERDRDKKPAVTGRVKEPSDDMNPE